MDIFVFAGGAVTGAVTFYCLSFVFGHGYVTKRQYDNLSDQVEGLQERIIRYQSKINMRNGREKKAENLEEFKANFPALVEKLPITEEQKEFCRTLPVDLIISLLKKEKII